MIRLKLTDAIRHITLLSSDAKYRPCRGGSEKEYNRGLSRGYREAAEVFEKILKEDENERNKMEDMRRR